MDDERQESSPLDEGSEMIAHSAQAAYAVSAAVKAGRTAAGAAGCSCPFNPQGKKQLGGGGSQKTIGAARGADPSVATAPTAPTVLAAAPSNGRGGR